MRRGPHVRTAKGSKLFLEMTAARTAFERLGKEPVQCVRPKDGIPQSFERARDVKRQVGRKLPSASASRLGARVRVRIGQKKSQNRLLKNT